MTRIMDNLHFPSDVLAALLIGSFTAFPSVSNIFNIVIVTNSSGVMRTRYLADFNLNKNIFWYTGKVCEWNWHL